jgi:serine/threonine protein kinase
MISEKTVGSVNREFEVVQLEDLKGIERVYIDKKDKTLFGYVVFNARLQSRRVHLFSVKEKKDIQVLREAMPADSVGITDAEKAAKHTQAIKHSETITAKYLGNAPITSPGWAEKNPLVAKRMALVKSKDPKKQIAALMECAGFLLSESLKDRRKDGSDCDNDVAGAVVLVATESVRVMNELTSERYSSTRPNDIVEVQVLDVPVDRALARASVIGKSNKGKFKLPQKSLMSDRERQVVMDRIKSGELSKEAAMLVILDAEQDLAEQSEECLVVMGRRNEKLHIVECDVLLASRRNADAIKKAIKVAKNKLETMKKGPFLKVTHAAPLPNPELEAFNMSRANLVAVKHVGNGQFGDVYLANMTVNEGNAAKHLVNDAGVDEYGKAAIQVAVKTLKAGSSKEDQDQFVDECLLQCKLSHKNLVAVLGVCMAHRPYLCVLEFALYGDLQEVLQACEHKHIAIAETEFLHLLAQLAAALAYLHGNRTVHIDLASRNCLLYGDSLLKLADFGLARNYTAGRNCWRMAGPPLMLPFRQMPPETLAGSLWDPKSRDIFSPKFRENTDMWAFGCVIWEFTENGKELYDELKLGLMPLMKRIKQGLRLKFKESAPPALVALAKRCFHNDADQRPKFAELADELEEEVISRTAASGIAVRDVGSLINASLASRLKEMSTAATLQGRKKEEAPPLVTTLNIRHTNNPHMWQIHNYMSPAFCCYCKKLLKGLFKQGQQCQMCGLNCHLRCTNEMGHSCGDENHPTIDDVKGTSQKKGKDRTSGAGIEADVDRYAERAAHTTSLNHAPTLTKGPGYRPVYAPGTTPGGGGVEEGAVDEGDEEVGADAAFTAEAEQDVVFPSLAEDHHHADSDEGGIGYDNAEANPRTSKEDAAYHKHAHGSLNTSKTDFHLVMESSSEEDSDEEEVNEDALSMSQLHDLHKLARASSERGRIERKSGSSAPSRPISTDGMDDLRAMMRDFSEFEYNVREVYENNGDDEYADVEGDALALSSVNFIAAVATDA